MKKLLSLAMAAAMSLTLTACGNGGTSTPQSSQPNPSNSSNSSVIGGADSSTEIVTTDSDLAYIQNKGTLIVGITEFEPMDYQNSDGEWIGFDADLAKAFAESLGVEVKFQVIDWSNKVFELDGKTIDAPPLPPPPGPPGRPPLSAGRSGPPAPRCPRPGRRRSRRRAAPAPR